jgi:hypothetical protein
MLARRKPQRSAFLNGLARTGAPFTRSQAIAPPQPAITGACVSCPA